VSVSDIRELDRRAVRGSVAAARGAGAADLGLATPCAEWTLGELLAHMTAQHDGFAAAAAGRGADLAQWEAGPPGDDPVAGYAAAAERVIAAFAEPGVLERKFELPEILPGARFPAAQAISFHFIDYVVHGWDVARSLGVPYELDDDLAEAALAVARAVPDGPERLRPGAAFSPGLTARSGAPALEEILSVLGRSPDWQP
jgi:uncharacterized protein (TIGR03086 family)